MAMLLGAGKVLHGMRETLRGTVQLYRRLLRDIDGALLEAV